MTQVERDSQEGNETEEETIEAMERGEASKRKKGFVKSPRTVEYELFGPNSPYPEKWRVFNFIKYRIQDNKKKDEAQRITRGYILAETGVWKNNFSRIIEDLIADKLIQVERGNYRNSTFTYWLSRERFKGPTISVDKAKAHVDKSKKKQPATKSQHQNDATKHQNDVPEHQNDVEPRASGSESLGNSSLRSPLPIASILKPLLPKKEIPKETNVSSVDRKQRPSPSPKMQRIWLTETDGLMTFEKWLETNGVYNESNPTTS